VYKRQYVYTSYFGSHWGHAHCMHACMHACVSVWMYASMHACMHPSRHACMHSLQVITHPLPPKPFDIHSSQITRHPPFPSPDLTECPGPTPTASSARATPSWPWYVRACVRGKLHTTSHPTRLAFFPCNPSSGIHGRPPLRPQRQVRR